MRAIVEFHPDAIEEARAARKWYEKRSVYAAAAFIAEMDAAVDKIADAPERWPEYRHGTRRCPFRRFPYFIVYRQTGNIVQIVAVVHSRRRPGYWKIR